MPRFRSSTTHEVAALCAEALARLACCRALPRVNHFHHETVEAHLKLPFRLLAETATPDGQKLSLHTHDGQFYLKLNGRGLMSTTATSSEILLAELACETIRSRPHASVLIGGLGLGYSLRRVAELVDRTAVIHVAELIPEVPKWNREFLHSVNGQLLEDPRVQLVVDDVFEILSRAPDASFDAILLDVDNGPIAMVEESNSRIYQAAGFDRLKRVLRPKGRVAFWSASEDKPFERRLQKAGFRVQITAAKAYPLAKRSAHWIIVAER